MHLRSKTEIQGTVLTVVARAVLCSTGILACVGFSGCLCKLHHRRKPNTGKNARATPRKLKPAPPAIMQTRRMECSKPGLDRTLGFGWASLGLPQGNVKN